MKKNFKYGNIAVFACANMGDFIWATSALSLIKDYDKSINITLVAFDVFIKLTDKNLFIDRIVPVNYKYYNSKNIFIRYAYKIFFCFTGYFNLHKCDSILFLDQIYWMALTAKYFYKIKNISGPATLWLGYDTKNPDAKFYTNPILLPKDADRTPIIMRYQLLVRSLFPTYNLSLPKVADTSYLAETVDKKLIKKAKKYKIALCTVGSVSWRYWDREYFKELILKLTNDDITFFVVGNDKKADENAQYLKNNLKDVDIRNLCGKTSVPELIEFLKNMDLLISVDTGVVHLAAVNRIPTISMHGTTAPEQSGAVNHKAVSLYSCRKCSPCNFNIWKYNNICEDIKCMRDITPHMVFEEAKKILKELPSK